MIIGLSGYARTGKDTFADILVREHGFRRYAFADKVREAYAALDPVIGFELEPEAGGGLFSHQARPVYLHELLEHPHGGWEYAKGTPYKDEVRRGLQRMGTELGRDLFGGDFWVDRLFDQIIPWPFESERRVVITDMRFENEAIAVLDHGGVAVRIHRAGVGPANDHVSEIGLDDWTFDYEVHNDGSLSDLAAWARSLVHTMTAPAPFE